MKQLLFSFITCILISGMFSCNNTSEASQKKNSAETDNELTETQIKEGWKLLFDGTTTNGWHTFRKGRVSSAWSATDGKLVFTPSDEENSGGDLLTDDQYEKFHLKMDWKISDCGNSGIMFLVQEKGREKTYHTGPEMQVLDNTCHADAKYPTHRAGSLYDMIQAEPETVKPAGQWNNAEVILNDVQLTFLLNGTKVVETEIFNQKWENMIANSKFKQWPGFGTFKKGHIALQDHGNQVEFKNMMIKELQ